MLTNKEKITILIKRLNEDYNKNKDLFTPQEAYLNWKEGNLASLNKIATQLTEEYNEDFLFRVSYGRISHLLFSKNYNTIIYLTMDGEIFTILEKITVRGIDKLENIKYKEIL